MSPEFTPTPQAMFKLGQAFSALPTATEVRPSTTPTENELTPRDGHDVISVYDNIIDWRTLQALARGIAEHQPDGLETPMDIVTSLLSQVRSSGNTANFFYGEEELAMTAMMVEEKISFEWDEKLSPIPRIANDAGYQLNAEDLKSQYEPEPQWVCVP